MIIRRENDLGYINIARSPECLPELEHKEMFAEVE